MARLYAGDLAIIMKMFERMDDRIKQSEVFGGHIEGDTGITSEINLCRPA